MTRYDVEVNDKQSGQPGADPPAKPAERPQQTRRTGSPRRNASDEPVQLYLPGGVISGWLLNLSDSGLRAIVEDSIEAGVQLELTIGDSEQRRPARVVWVREEKGGSVLGVSFLDQGHDPPHEQQ